MAMRETVSSLRVYLVLSGFAASASYVRQLTSAPTTPLVAISLAGLALSIAYIYVGLGLKTLLTTAPDQIKKVLFTGAAYLGFIFLAAILAGGVVQGLISAGVGLIVTWYIFINVQRLTREIHGTAGVATARTSS